MKRKLVTLLFIAMCLPQAWAASKVITTNASGCPASSNTTALVVPLPQDKGGATLDIQGTWTGTISFYMTANGGATWVAMNAMPVGATTAVATTTANGTWQRNVAGFTGLCMLSSASMTGSATVTINPSAAPAPATY